MLQIGKVPPEILEKIVMKPILGNEKKRKDIVLRPSTGEDCSAIDLGDELCVVSTDPITGAAKDIGFLAVQINCNDIYSAGAEPIGVLLTILLPPESTEELLEEIMTGAMQAGKLLNVEILGGHTEVTDAVCKPLVSATVLGKTKERKILCTKDAKVGDDVVMSKFAGLEGTTILAKEHEGFLSQIFSAEELTEAKEMSALLSVGKESEIAFAHGANAMHDATEGGVFGAVWELAQCSGLGVTLWQEKIPVHTITKKLCDLGKISPYRLISSGCMIIATKDGAGLVAKLQEAGIESAVIGVMTEKEKVLVVNGAKMPLQEPESDDLYRVDFT